MKKISKNPIDQYFREVLKSPDLKYNKQDWKGFEKMLPRESKRKGIGWWFPASIAAALVLFFGGLWLLNKPIINIEKLSKTKQELPKEGSLTDNLPANKETVSPDLQEDPPTKGEGTGLSVVPKNNNAARDAENIAVRMDRADGHKSGQRSTTLPEIEQSEHPYVKQQFQGFSLRRNDSLLLARAQTRKLNVTIGSPPKPAKGERVDLKDAKNSRLSVGLAFSPDINSVSGFKTGKLGQSFGVSASYRISSRISLNTGVAYSTKLYSAQPDQYKAPWSYSNAARYAESIDADCRVLDVPINLKYNLAQSSKRAMFVSAGVSSYFMLHEKYTLIAAKSQPGYPAYPNRSYEYSKQNEHLLSVLNLSAGMAKPLNRQTSVVIEPYARLPLTGVGEGKVNLKSIGLNFRLQYNFRKKEKTRATSVIAVQ